MWNGPEQEKLRPGANGSGVRVPIRAYQQHQLQQLQQQQQQQPRDRNGRGSGSEELRGDSRRPPRAGSNYSSESNRRPTDTPSATATSRRPPSSTSSSRERPHPPQLQQMTSTTFIKTTKKQRKTKRGGNNTASTTTTSNSNYSNSFDSFQDEHTLKNQDGIRPAVVTTVLRNASPFTDIQKQHNAMAEKHGLFLKRDSNSNSNRSHQTESTDPIQTTPATSTSTVTDVADEPPAQLTLPPHRKKSLMIYDNHNDNDDNGPAIQHRPRDPPSPLVHQPPPQPKSLLPSRSSRQPTNIVLTRSLQQAQPKQQQQQQQQQPVTTTASSTPETTRGSGNRQVKDKDKDKDKDLGNSSSSSNSNKSSGLRSSWQQKGGRGLVRSNNNADNNSNHKLDPSSNHSHSHSHSNTTGGGWGQSFRGFLTGGQSTRNLHNHHTQAHSHNMTKEERRDAQNPFKNRPKPMLMGSSYRHGVMTHQDQRNHMVDHSGLVQNADGGAAGANGEIVDHQRRRYYDESGREEEDDPNNPNKNNHNHNHNVAHVNTMESSGNSYHTKTYQQQYCPLPKPLQKAKDICGVIVCNQGFQIIMVVLIMLNALVLGVATYDFENENIDKTLDEIDRIFLIIFTIELALQFGYCGYSLFLDPWLVFDTLTIVTSWWLDGVQVFRSFRIFRSFRLIVRLPLLKNLVLTVFHVMPRINSILALLILILYIYGVMVTVLFGDMFEKGQLDYDYFGDLFISMFTLLQFVTLEGWGDVVRQVAAHHRMYASLLFSSFIVITGFIMYNLIVAVMCDSMLVIEQQGREKKREKQEALQRQERMDTLHAEEEKQKEMVKQRADYKAQHQLEKARGLVSDDPTHTSTGNEVDRSKEDYGIQLFGAHEEKPQFYSHVCQHCGEMSQIRKYPTALRRRNEKRDMLAEENQQRIRALKDKIDALGKTQETVMGVLENIMKGMDDAPRQQGNGRR